MKNNISSFWSANKPKPRVVTNPTFQKMFPGESVTFQCLVIESSGWDYRWYRNGKEIEASNNPIHTIVSADLSDSGEYHCTATRGTFNTQSETTTLQVAGRHLFYTFVSLMYMSRVCYGTSLRRACHCVHFDFFWHFVILMISMCNFRTAYTDCETADFLVSSVPKWAGSVEVWSRQPHLDVHLAQEWRGAPRGLSPDPEWWWALSQHHVCQSNPPGELCLQSSTQTQKRHLCVQQHSYRHSLWWITFLHITSAPSVGWGPIGSLSTVNKKEQSTTCAKLSRLNK